MNLFNTVNPIMENEWILFYLTGTGIFFLLTLSFVMVVILHKKRQQQYFHEKKLMKEQFKMELVKTEMDVKEENSKQIARELHDNIGQLANQLKMYQSYLIMNMKNYPKKIMTEWDETLKQLISEIRNTTSELNGTEILSNGLGSAIQKDINRKSRISEIEFNTNINFEIHLDASVSIFLYRIYQEVMSNIFKHAKATVVTIDFYREGSNAVLIISDSGIGFDVITQKNNGSGLKHIKERCDLINAQLIINSRPTFEGTQIKILIPCQKII